VLRLGPVALTALFLPAARAGFPRAAFLLKSYSIRGIGGGGCPATAWPFDTRGDRLKGLPSAPYSTGKTPGETPRGDRRGGGCGSKGGVAGRSATESMLILEGGDRASAPSTTESNDMFATKVFTSSSSSPYDCSEPQDSPLLSSEMTDAPRNRLPSSVGLAPLANLASSETWATAPLAISRTS